MESITSKSGKQIQVKELSLEDIQALADFYAKLTLEDTYIWANPEEPSSYKEIKTEVEGYVKNHDDKLYLVAYFNNELIGYVSMDRSGKRRGHVGDFGLIVAKEYRREGIGEALSRLIIDKASKKWSLTLILLDTFDINQAAIKLYEKLGFKKYGHRQGTVLYKGNYIGEVLMQKDL